MESELSGGLVLLLHVPLLLVPTVSGTYLIRSLYEPLPYQKVSLTVLAAYMMASLILGTRVMKLKEK